MRGGSGPALLPAWARAPWRVAALWMTAHAAVFLLLFWARELRPVYLVAAAAAVLAAAWAGRARLLTEAPLRPVLLALAVTLVGVAGGAWSAHRFQRIEFDWDRLVAERQATLGAQLERRMRTVVERGQRAVDFGAEAAAHDRWTLFRELATIRERTGVDALAVFSDAGDLVAWAGEHRGLIPQRVRAGEPGVAFAERPLFSYLYFSSPPLERGRHVVAALLLESGLVAREPETRVLAGTTTLDRPGRALFRAGGAPDAAWQHAVDGDTVVHARFERVTQAEARARVAVTTRAVTTVAGLLALLLLTVGWLRRRPAGARVGTIVPLAAFAAAFVIAPLGAAFGLHRLFSPVLFLLPGPGDLTLGALLALLLVIAALVAALRTPVVGRRAFLAALGAGVLAVAFGYPAALRMLRQAAAPGLLEGGAAFWIGLQLAATLLLVLLTVLALPRLGTAARAPARGPHGSALYVGAALVVAALLAGLRVWDDGPRWLHGDAYLALWFLPFVLGAIGLAPLGGQLGRLARWLVAGWIAASAVLGTLWTVNVAARLAAAEREIATLGAHPDVYFDYLLYDFGREAQARHAAGEDGLLLLYRTWVASGLAREPYSARIMLWSPDALIEQELGVGGAPEPDPYLGAVERLVRETAAEAEPRVVQAFDLADVSRILLVPLPDARVVTAVVPPRRTLAAPTSVAPFLGGLAPADARLSLVPVRVPTVPHDDVYWIRSSTGWRSETVVRYADGDYHAHLEVRLMPIGVRLARASLLLAFDLIVLALLWTAGNAARGLPLVPRAGWASIFGGFRTRITLALFIFFLLPTALFGWVAYGALAGEVARATRLVAERAAALAVLEFPLTGGDLRELAAHAGSDVLFYHFGELAAASSPEALELGVYDAWMPPHVFRVLQLGEESAAVETHQLGGHEFLTAYHSLMPVGTLAVPMSLAAGDAAVRQREMAHLVLFAVLVGALLSFALSLVVGRALAGPIGLLRRAAAGVGAGNLKVRLPERGGGEFGQLFASFNRMVRRLRRARARELRTARVLAWGEMARQIAHEIKNPLTPIKLSVQHLRRARADRRPDFDEILDSSVTQILAEIDRLTEIARAFSRYGAPSALAGPLDRVDVGAVVRETLTLYRTGEPRIRYVDALAADLPPVLARADELKEVVLNLLENARVAVGEAGTITVGATRINGMVELTVSDDGPGIPPELLPHIFEPHFSTRSAGTGLGLPIVRRIVEGWGGAVSVDGDHRPGATLRVRMPVAG